VTQSLPPWKVPFVVDQADLADVVPERHGVLDLYATAADRPRPAVVLLHGGPIPAGLPVTPRDWPVYRGYGAMAAAAGVVGVTVDHPLHAPEDYPTAHAVVADAIDAVRADPRVDRDRIAVWAFSGGSPLLSPWLRRPPSWLRCLAATYPLLDSGPDSILPAGFRPVEALAAGPSVPFVLTRVGLESPPVAEGVDRFLTAAKSSGLAVDIVDVSHGHHGFDTVDPGPESAAAVRRALALVVHAVRSWPDPATPGDPRQ
jgi:acetyl esterase/lipase